PRPVEDSNQWSTDHVSTLEVNIDGQTAQVLQSVAPDVMGVDVQDLVAGLVTVAVARTMPRPVEDSNQWSTDHVSTLEVNIDGQTAQVLQS
ncbi:hypothetical protein HT105_24525, partial [Bacteroides fragilis]|nr:hypothetical protein [Bacteroides fragilis]